MIQRIISSPHGVAAVVSAVAFLVYLRTLAPTVSFIDSGELAAVACTLGVAHPTGYPLFTLLGWVFSKLPIASEEIVRLNIMAAVFCAAGVYFFFHVVYLVLTLVAKRMSSMSKRRDVPPLALISASAACSLILAFSETYWSQALSIEVYSLHLLLLSIVILSFLKASFSEPGEYPEGNTWLNSAGWWMLFAFTLGLAFANHMTTILLAPGFVYLYFATQGNGAASWRRIGKLAIPFLLGLSVYLYLPIRALQSPALNWGNTATLEKFLWHLSGKQYRVWIFSSTESAGRQLKYFINNLPDEVAYVGLFVAFLGLTTLWRVHRRLFIATALLFVSCVFYSINYDIHDIDSYFLLAYICVALWGGAGFVKVFSWISQRTALRTSIVAALIIVVGLVPLAFHYNKSNESDNYLVEDYTMNMFASLRPDALVLSFQWDYWVSASLYYQLVKGVRTDVAVVDKELLRRSWYLKELEGRYPWLIQRSRPEVNAFLLELHKFEHDLPYNPNVIQARFVAMISSFIRNNMSERPVYVTAEIEPEFTQGLARIPEGLGYRLAADAMPKGSREVPFKYRHFERRGRLEDGLRGMYANSLISKGKYHYALGELEAAKVAFSEALAYSPGSREAGEWLTRLQK